MNKKILYSAILLLLALVFICSYSFAAENNMLQDAANGVRNMVSGAENALEGAAGSVSNTSKDITGNLQNAGNNMGNSIINTVDNIGNTVENTVNNNNDNTENTTENMTGFTQNDNSSADYTATRTGTTTDDATFLGLTSTAWTWLIVGLAVIAIGILIYSYVAQNNTSHYEDFDE